MNKIKKKFINLELVVIPIENNFFGKTITVSGLVTGIDLINQLRNCKDADKIIIPKSMLKRDEDIFLDNITIDEVEKQLNKKIIASNVDGKEFIEFLKLGVM